jgi:hypothetical protein
MRPSLIQAEADTEPGPRHLEAGTGLPYSPSCRLPLPTLPALCPAKDGVDKPTPNLLLQGRHLPLIDLVVVAQ